MAAKGIDNPMATVPFEVIEWARKVRQWGGYTAAEMCQHLRDKGYDVKINTLMAWLKYKSRLNA